MITSKLSSKAQTVLPRAVHEHLGVGPGDELVYEFLPDAVIVRAAKRIPEDPFACFDEWKSAADEKAYAGF